MNDIVFVFWLNLLIPFALSTLLIGMFAWLFVERHERDGLLLSWTVVLLLSAPSALYVVVYRKAIDIPANAGVISALSAILIFFAIPFLLGSGIALLFARHRRSSDDR